MLQIQCMPLAIFAQAAVLSNGARKRTCELEKEIVRHHRPSENLIIGAAQPWVARLIGV